MKPKKETKQEELFRILSMPREQRPGVKSSIYKANRVI